MNLLGWVLFVALEILLVNYASSSTCQMLNNTLFTDCTKAGYNVTELIPNRRQKELSGLIATMQSKFKNCSSLSSLMTCSVQLPKCPTAASKLPCKDACTKFVSECQNRSPNENDGLIALFRGICELLPSKNCLPTPNNLTNSVFDAAKCRRLTINQCQNAGYSFTSVSDAYQQIVAQSSAIFQDSNVNSTLRKIICMEIAPPCDAKNNQAFIVPCRSMCDDSFNESRSQFVKVFKAQKYCSTFPDNTTGDGKEYCTLQDWPDNGYWPSGLWASLATAGQQSTPPAMASETTSVPVVNTTTPTPTASATSPVPPFNTTTPTPMSYTSKTASTTNVTPSVSKAIGTIPEPTPSGNRTAPSTNGTTPASTPRGNTAAPSTKGTTPAPTPSRNTTAPSTKGTTPAPTPSANTTASSTKGTTPAPTPSGSTPASSTKGTTPAPSPSGSTPAPSTKGTTPAPTPGGSTTASSTKGTTPASTPSGSTTAPSTKGTTPAATPNGTTPAPSTKGTTPAPTPSGNTTASSTKGTTPAPTPSGNTPAPSTKGTTPTSTPKGTTPAPSTNGTTPASTPNGNTGPSTKRSTHATTPRGPRTSSSSTSEMKSSSPPVASAGKGGKMSAGAIAGTLLGLLILLVAIVVGAICFRRYHKTKSQYRHSLMVDMDEL